MIEDKTEDETYSLIFASLKHPIRRRILRMLAEKPLTYSEILEILSIDSGHFSYHLDTLGDLTFKDKNGRYHLSSFGKATAKLMGGVEENVPATTSRRTKPTQLFTKAYSIILVLVLVCASAFFISYVAAVPDASETTRWAFSSNQSVSIGDAKTSNLDFVLAAASAGDGTNSIDVNIGFEGTSSLTQQETEFFGWYEDSMWLEMSQSVSSTQDGMEGSMQVSNDTLPDVTKLSSGRVAKFYDPKISRISFETDFSRLSVDISTPNGTVITDCFQRDEEPYTVNYVSVLQPGWLIESSNTTKFKSCEIPINQLGSYNIKITNGGDSPWSGTFALYLQSERMERPYFFLGIAALVAAIGYLIFVAITSMRRGEPDESEQNP